MINNKFSSKVFSEYEHKNHCPPDDYIYLVESAPDDNFVLCRENDGTPTAIYGKNKWDLNPYSLSASKITVIHFSNGLDKASLQEKESLISEMKYLMFCLMYFINSGHKGLLTPATLISYFNMIRKAAQFCVQMKERPLVGILSLKDIFSNKTYLSALCKNNQSVTFNKKMPAFLNHLASLNVEKLGFTAVQPSELTFGNKESEQHPIIPIRIYLNYMDEFEDRINAIYDNSENITNFLIEFKDHAFGCTTKTQKNYGVGKKSLRPTMPEAIEAYELNYLFNDIYKIKSKSCLTVALTQIYFLAKNIIHLYTGMRSEEVLRLPYDCLMDYEITSNTVDDSDNVVDKAKMISMLSTTTKFEGYKKSASWLATEEVLKAVEVSKRISKAISIIKGLEPSQRILFESPTIITHKKNIKSAIPSLGNVTDSINLYYIDKNDYDQVVISDPDRNFQKNKKFQIGKPWHLTSHQFRRSLAYYASNSGFVSMPTIKRQFKHTSLKMSRYYSRNFEQIKTIFGFYDETKDEFVLPDGHMAYEFQMAMPINMADQIISDVLGEDNQLFGKTGGYIERQKEKLDKGAINIVEIREDTIKRVDKGELSYRSTLLGGCTKIGSCDTAMLGEFTECLTCEGSIIKMDLVDEKIAGVESELSYYEVDSCEYGIVNQDLQKLKDYKKNKEKRVEYE
jgi:integrase